MFLIILIAIYLSAIAYLGYRGWRGTRTSADYLLAGGKTHPVVMALSYGATFISTSAIIGFGGAAAMFGMSLHWLTFFNIFFGIFIAFIFFGARTRTMGHHLQAHTFSELIGKRYASKLLQLFGGGVILIFMPIYTAAVLIGATNVIVATFNINYDLALMLFAIIVGIYVILGGLKGVMFAEALQGGLMFCGLLAVLGFTYYQLGGVITAHEKLSAIAPMAVEKWGELGHRGWTAMPEFGSVFWWTTMSQIVFGVGIGVLAQPQLIVRFMTVRSNRELNRAVLVGAVFILITVGVSYCVGPLANLFFLEVPSRLDGQTFSTLALTAAKSIDMIIPLFIQNFMPKWLGDIFFVTLLAAAMSTVSSQFHAMGTAASRDIFENLFPARKEKMTMLAARGGSFLVFLWSVFIAESLPRIFAHGGTAIIARGTAVFFGLCAATFLPLFIGGLYSRWITRAGALSGAFAGFALSFFWLFFVKAKEASDLKLCGWLTGTPHWAAYLQNYAPDWFRVAEVDPTVIALPVSLAITLGVSLITPKFSDEHLEKCFR